MSWKGALAYLGCVILIVAYVIVGHNHQKKELRDAFRAGYDLAVAQGVEMYKPHNVVAVWSYYTDTEIDSILEAQ